VPYTGISKFVAIGLNYVDHAHEAGLQIPAEPVVFMKATTCISGPNDDVQQPRNSTKLDYEVEIAIVIGPGPSTFPRTRRWIMWPATPSSTTYRSELSSSSPRSGTRARCRHFRSDRALVGDDDEITNLRRSTCGST